MKMTISTAVWKYVLLMMSTLISMVVVVFLTSGIVALGGAGSEMGAYLVTGVGCLVMSLSFCGCFASLRESYCLSILYLVLTALSIVLEMVLMIGFMIEKDATMEMAENRIECLWEKQNEGKVSGAMDGVQIYYSCCGRESPQDYLKDGGGILPASCCLDGDCSAEANVFAKGCIGALKVFIDNQSVYLIMSTLGLIIIEVVGFVAAFYLAKRVKNIVEKPERIFIDE